MNSSGPLPSTGREQTSTDDLKSPERSAVARREATRERRQKRVHAAPLSPALSARERGPEISCSARYLARSASKGVQGATQSPPAHSPPTAAPQTQPRHR